ncbi:hypothetical protein BGZ93_000951, partial [Podila epicladia]
MWHINLVVKQKAVMQPTLKHMRWMEVQKANPLKMASTQPSQSFAPTTMSLMEAQE